MTINLKPEGPIIVRKKTEDKNATTL